MVQQAWLTISEDIVSQEEHDRPPPSLSRQRGHMRRIVESA
jgi:hypothetical protein